MNFMEKLSRVSGRAEPRLSEQQGCCGGPCPTFRNERFALQQVSLNAQCHHFDMAEDISLSPGPEVGHAAVYITLPA